MQAKCANCKWRIAAEKNPGRLMSRLWYWHTRWYPGWKAYQKELGNNRSN